MTERGLMGYLVAYERAHLSDDWRWIAFTDNLHDAVLIARDWGRGHDPACSACVSESRAQIFQVPPDVELKAGESTSEVSA